MPNGTIDPLTGPMYVLEGRVVTMGEAGVLDDGAIYIDRGMIRAVQDASAPEPAGFAGASRIKTGDTIYPGLIELHNHLSYNAMPLWDVPRRYSNHTQWKRHPDYRRFITKPAQVLGQTENVVEAVVRYVECRCLLGGVTASQGITLAGANGIQALYEGIIRNVERTGDPALPNASPKIGDPQKGGAAAYLQKLRGKTCYLQHLSEGVDAKAHELFERLQLEDGTWAITDALCGVHSTALNAGDFRILRERGGSMVWSPLSNYLLYGATADIRAAAGAGVPIALGCDWAPSGTKNLLGELKVAWLVSRHLGARSGGDPVFSAEEIVAMATRNPADILKWGEALGRIEAGKHADLVVVNAKGGDPYMHLIDARETSITLVVINGVARVGQKHLMEPFGPGTEELEVGGAARILDLAQETSHPLVRDLKLADAISRLEQAMADLPALARDLDARAGGGVFGGSTDASGAAWRIVPDFEEEDAALEAELGRGAMLYAPYVQPMVLPGVTVADDRGHLPALAAARNVPEFVKEGLPPLYGRPIALPQGAAFLQEAAPESVAPQLLETRDLKTFLRTWGTLTLEGRKTIVDQAIVLLRDNYVHLPLKQAMHAADPVQRLELLRHRLDRSEEGQLRPELQFHDELLEIFASLRDLHTTYRLPRPFASKTAWLPFRIEECWEHGHRQYLVSRIVHGAGPEAFVEGVRILHWNGMPIEQAVARNAARQAGSNLAARRARGLDSLTIRPLASVRPPDEEWVTLHFVGEDGEVRELTQQWLVFEPGRSPGSVDPGALLAPSTALGVDAQTDDVQEAKKVLFGGDTLREIGRLARAGRREAIQNTEGGIATLMPTIFRAKRVQIDAHRFGLVRIFSFNVGDAAAFVEEFMRLAAQLPREGLIIDVRGNGGGLIHAAERLLQVLTPKAIEPERANFINSRLNLAICKSNAPSKLVDGFTLEPWIDSIEQSVETGATYSLGYPITPVASCNDIGQRYYGPVLLITDALCYSATDIFAAGFSDHDIGPILGTAENTGAGGANVWSHRLLRRLLRQDATGGEQERSPYVPLPEGADLRVAIRRTLRVGAEAGNLVEDLGIRPEQVHRMTRRDVLEGNVDLIARAGRILAAQVAHDIEVEVEEDGRALPTLSVRTRHVERLDVRVDGRPRGSFDVTGDETRVDLAALAGEAGARGVDVVLRGFSAGALVVALREHLGGASTERTRAGASDATPLGKDL